MKKSLIVFICSSYSDLVIERESVLQAITKLQHQHDCMEYFGARTNRPIETCLEEVRRSNVLIVIVGYCYGSLVPEMGISFSEAEYREGYELGKPCLVYFKDENVPILPKYMDRDPKKIKLLEKFKTTLRSRHTIATFKDSHDLSVSVVADLTRIVRELECSGKFEKKVQNSLTPTLNESNQIIADTINYKSNKSQINDRNMIINMMKFKPLLIIFLLFSLGIIYWIVNQYIHQETKLVFHNSPTPTQVTQNTPSYTLDSISNLPESFKKYLKYSPTQWRKEFLLKIESGTYQVYVASMGDIKVDAESRIKLLRPKFPEVDFEIEYTGKPGGKKQYAILIGSGLTRKVALEIVEYAKKRGIDLGKGANLYRQI